MKETLIQIMMIIIIVIFWKVPTPKDFGDCLGLLVGAIALTLFVLIERDAEREKCKKQGGNEG